MTQPETPIPAPPLGEEPAKLPAGELRVKLFARTDVGQIREHNEDNFLVADLTRRSRGLLEANRSSVIGPHGSLFAVCDGMGGAAAGEIASQLAVDIIYEHMTEGLDDPAPMARDDLARRLVRAVETAGLRIFQEAKADRTRRGMGTTVTAAALVDDHLFLAQVGDSRGYILRGEQLVQVTRDQSLVNQLIEAGQLTEEEAETFEHNNIILQALGTSDTVQVDLTYVELRRGDTLLLCSDGLSGMVRFEEIREILRTATEPLDACKLLTDRANQAGGHDNITVIVVRFDGEAFPLLAADAEALKYRKYSIPEEPPDPTERQLPSSRAPDSAPAMGPSTPQAGPAPQLFAPGHPGTGGADGSTVPQGLAGTVVFGPPPAIASPLPGQAPMAAAPQAAWSPRGPHAGGDEERIEIPGTHVPGWIVAALVVVVVVVIGALAFLLLR